MKTIRLLTVVTVLGLSAVSSAIAATSLVQAPAYSAPVPLQVVHPTDLPVAYRNVTVSVEFTLDRNGVAHNVVPVGEMPKDLAARLLPAISQWKFAPCCDAKGQPIQMRVVMPVKLIDGGV